jgi:NitT/TauT family transport system substrate-binding protein
MRTLKSWIASALAAVALAAPLATGSAAQDKVKVGVFPVASSLPYFVALDRGYFKEQNIDVETVRLIGGPPIVAALIADQIDAASVLVTLEGMNANIKKPGSAIYISLNSQSQTYPMEQFVIRQGFSAKNLKDLKGARILSAPGPGNVLMAKAALEANGLKEGDYRLEQLDTAQHLGALKAGTYDAGYTLEPNATVMRKQGIASTLEAGVIAHYVLGDPKADAFVGGGVMSSRFINDRPDVAKRYATAWLKAINDIKKDPEGARRHLLKNTLTPDDVVGEVPMLGYFTIAELTDNNKKQFQQFIDFSMKLINAPEKIEVDKYMKAY